MVSRRALLTLVCSTASLGLASGCLNYFQESGVGIRIENHHDQQHRVNITVEENNETIFTNQYSVSSGEETRISEVVDAGEYLVTIDLDSTEVKNVDFVMNGCDRNYILVRIFDDGEWLSGILNQC